MIIYGTYECQEFSSRNLSICFPVTNAMVCITQTRSHTQVSNHSNNIGTEYVYMQEWAKLWENSLSACSTSQLWNKDLCLKPNSSSVHRTRLQNIEFSPCFHHGSLFIITFLFVSPNQEYYLGKSDFAITFSSMSLANLTLVPECTKRKTRRMLLLHVSRSTTLFKPNEKTVNIENEQINARRKLKLNLQWPCNECWD